MNFSEVPAYNIVESKVKEINENIVINSVDYISERMMFKVTLIDHKVGRGCEVIFSREFLDDLKDFTGSEASSYWKKMDSDLLSILLKPIEKHGLIPFAKDKLKEFIFEHVKMALQNTEHINKFNLLGRPYQNGSLEHFLGVKFTDGERTQAGMAFDELKVQGVLIPTYKDMINPDDWVKISDKGVSAAENKDHVESTKKEHFINKGEVFNAYQIIITIMKNAKTELIVIDPWIDDSVLSMIASLNSEVKVIILYAKPVGDFNNALRKLQLQRKNIEVKKTKHFHDRFLIIDKLACYHLGSSIKDAGNKVTMIDKKEDITRNKVLGEVNKLLQ